MTTFNHKRFVENCTSVKKKLHYLEKLDKTCNIHTYEILYVTLIILICSHSSNEKPFFINTSFIAPIMCTQIQVRAYIFNQLNQVTFFLIVSRYKS